MIKVTVGSLACYLVLYKGSGTSNPVTLGAFDTQKLAEKFRDAYISQKYAIQTLPTKEVYVEKLNIATK